MSLIYWILQYLNLFILLQNECNFTLCAAKLQKFYFTRHVRRIVKKRLLASSCLPVCMEHLRFHCTDFHEILHFRIFRKSIKKNQVWLNLTRMTGTSHDDLRTFLITSLLTFWNEQFFFRHCRENQNTPSMFCHFFFWKSRRLWDNMGKYGIARQATDDDIIRHRKDAICAPGN